MSKIGRKSALPSLDDRPSWIKPLSSTSILIRSIKTIALLITMPAKPMTPSRGHEPKIAPSHQETDHDTDETQRDGEQDDQGPANGVGLSDEQEQDDQSSYRHLCSNRIVGFTGALDFNHRVRRNTQVPSSVLQCS